MSKTIAIEFHHPSGGYTWEKAESEETKQVLAKVTSLNVIIAAEDETDEAKEAKKEAQVELRALQFKFAVNAQGDVVKRVNNPKATITTVNIWDDIEQKWAREHEENGTEHLLPFNMIFIQKVLHDTIDFCNSKDITDVKCENKEWEKLLKDALGIKEQTKEQTNVVSTDTTATSAQSA